MKKEKKLFLLIGKWNLSGTKAVGTIAVFDDRVLAKAFKKEYTNATKKAVRCKNHDYEHVIMMSSDYMGSHIETWDYNDSFLQNQILNPTLEQKFPELFEIANN